MVQELKIQDDNSQKFPLMPLMRPSLPKLQKSHDCWIVVQQPDSINPADWYANDPFKK